MSLADFLIAPRQQRLLAALLLHPERSYSYNELIKIGGAGRGVNQNALRRLLASGAAIGQRVGNQLRIRANPRFPLYAELRAICIKSFGVLERIRAALEPLAERIDFAFLFGSIVTATDRADSDIDLLVVGPIGLLELNSALEQAEEDLGRRIHVSLYGPQEWEGKSADRVVQRILSTPRLMVIGNDPAAATD